MKSDSMAALGVATKLSSPTPAMNFLGAELSLFLETEGMADPEGSHLPGKLNLCADYLSRLAPECPNKEKRPEELGSLQPTTLTKDFSFWLPGPGRRPELWGKRREEEDSDEPESRPMKRAKLTPRPGAKPLGAGSIQ